MDVRDSRPRAKGSTKVAVVLAIAAIAGTLSYLVAVYPTLTPFLPVHFGGGMIADRWRPRSWMLVLIPVWLQLTVAAASGAVAIILRARWRRSRPDTDDARRVRVTTDAVAWLAFVWIAFQAVAAVELVNLWGRGWGGLRHNYDAAVAVAALASAAIAWRAVRLMGKRPPEPDARFWRLNRLYLNRADPALFVPARGGFGYTLNFGRPVAVVLLALALLIGGSAPLVIVLTLIR